MADLWYIRPDELATLNASVTTSAGTTDTDYLDDWICDGRVGRPARATNGTVTWSASFSSAEVGLIAVCNCTSNVNATIGGGASATVTTGALQPNGIRLNGFASVTPVAITSLTVGFSGASSAVVLGELMAGKKRTLTRPVWSSDRTEIEDFTRSLPMDLASIPPYDPGLVARTWTGTFIVSTSTRDGIVEWFLAQRGGTRPSLVIPDSTVNDAWVCFLQKPSFKPAGGVYWSVDLTVSEVPRTRW